MGCPLEGFSRSKWENTKIEPEGTYFSINEFASPDGKRVFLRFGQPPITRQSPPLPLGSDPPIGTSIPRASNHEPADSGQFGLMLRYFAEAPRLYRDRRARRPHLPIVSRRRLHVLPLGLVSVLISALMADYGIFLYPRLESSQQQGLALAEAWRRATGRAVLLARVYARDRRRFLGSSPRSRPTRGSSRRSPFLPPSWAHSCSCPRWSGRPTGSAGSEIEFRQRVCQERRGSVSSLPLGVHAGWRGPTEALASG
jgi:hypothetical protein